MKVLDHEPQPWFLLEESGSLYFDANCDHSFAGYTVLIVLNDDEVSAYRRQGRDYLNRLADEIQYSAPGVIGNTSPFASRNLAVGQSEESARVVEAVEAWRSRA